MKWLAGLLWAVFLFCSLGNLSAQSDNVVSRLIGNDRLGKKDSVANWTIHAQITTVYQYHPAFHAAYSGINSLSNTANGALSLTSTIFVGRKLWKGAAICLNPELSGGQGFNGAHGVAGFTNGEIYRVGNPTPTPFIARLFIQQIIALRKSGYDFQPTDDNQLAGKMPASRVVITVGKFCLADFFDGNNYDHDARSQFLNWSLMASGSWDFPADTRGYTSGFVVETIKPLWAFRFSAVMVPRQANALQMDWQLNKANSETAEFEKDWNYKGHAGALRATAFISFTRAPKYKQVINAIQANDTAEANFLMDVISGKTLWDTFGGIKYGFGLNMEQDLGYGIGVFARGNWSDGHSADWAFTQIDNNLQLGALMKGTVWKRPTDYFGLAFATNGLSRLQRQYLELGGTGFIIGDGALTYGREVILETFYNVQLAQFLFISPDYQFIVNPGYNTVRGPVHVVGLRVHLEF
jgi:high affinity Mn2+ porin